MIRTCIVLSAVLAAAMSVQHNEPSEEDAIKHVIQSHYVEGIYVKRDPQLLRAGLAPSFVMQVYW